ncbi:uncharacterized protein LOC110872915 isoform X1 [Helianthus annuus]|uniref:uncharacterized protein LOC110872915 isoform X1 n=1 Tax=Helianthus annuus TaxID=4232 RepID=UPI000B90340B|nr:uncharacterized protein LOC110872915 isoform X1 [Helianthus annuus]
MSQRIVVVRKRCEFLDLLCVAFMPILNVKNLLVLWFECISLFYFLNNMSLYFFFLILCLLLVTRDSGASRKVEREVKEPKSHAKIDTCNGFYCETFTRNKPYKPKMFTELWTGCATGTTLCDSTVTASRNRLL